ncbi:MAG: EF-hand domain-containing protein [Steroidobacteraceae bacterium]
MKITITALGLLLAASSWAQAPATAQNSDAANTQQDTSTAAGSFNRRDADSFDKLDTNKDGQLSLDEYKIGRHAMRSQDRRQDKGAHGPQRQGRNAETRFKEKDKNNDGFIAKAEVSGTRMADRFDVMDTNQDGKLSLDEVKAGMQNRGGPNGAGPAGTGVPSSATAKQTSP